jgi:uncharacterized protein YbjQ (UPF0145 family)
MSTSKVFVTTTPSLDGWEIETYLGPVFSHIVAGTGFFSDFAASFSDVFGGRSQSYQKQLSEINSEAIELLKKKTSLLGGNLILGLKIDHDEISGKAKQMFMVTASGTAARGIQKSLSKGSEQHQQYLTLDALEIGLRKMTITAKSQTLPLALSDDEWKFVTDNQVHEIASQVLLDIQLYRKKEGAQVEGFMETRQAYFLALPSIHSVPILYGSLTESELVFPFVRDVIFKGDLFDFESIFLLLSTGPISVQRWALDLVRANKPYYEPSDIESFTRLCDVIKATFTNKVEFIEEQSRFTSTVKLKWQCECGTKNDKDLPRCSSCSRDVFGFTAHASTPDTICKLIESRIAILRGSFS